MGNCFFFLLQSSVKRIYQKDDCNEDGKHLNNQMGLPENNLMRLDYTPGNHCSLLGWASIAIPPLLNRLLVGSKMCWMDYRTGNCPTMRDCMPAKSGSTRVTWGSKQVRQVSPVTTHRGVNTLVMCPRASRPVTLASRRVRWVSKQVRWVSKPVMWGCMPVMWDCMPAMSGYTPATLQNTPEIVPVR